MRQVYVVHYHEIALKGRNRPMFLRQLKENICRTAGLKKSEVRIVVGRLMVIPPHSVTLAKAGVQINRGSPIPVGDDIIKQLGHVFGISSFSPAVYMDAEYPKIEYTLETTILDSMVVKPFGTFAVRAIRGDKKFSMTSKDLEIKLGDFVRTKFKKKVDLENPDVTFYAEVFNAGALVYTEKIAGPGGLPVGTQPKVAVLLSGGIDSPVAAYRLMKRGAPLAAVHFHSYPFTSRASIDKVKELLRILAQYHGGQPIPLYLVPLAQAQKQVVQKCSERYRVLLYRRLMWRIAQEIARHEKAQALVSGESLGQVASQTLENLTVVENAVDLPILRPLIGYDKEEIIAEAKKIGTYDLSIQPHDDCCTLFMPRQVATKARIGDVENEERKLDVSTLMSSALAKTERYHTT